MRPLLLGLALAACGGRTPPDGRAPRVVPPDAGVATAAPDAAPVPDPLGIDWATVAYATDDDALALWERLGLDGENFTTRLSFVPEDAIALREAMARALLRQGNFACPPVVRKVGCERTVLELPPLGPEHGLAHPCLRRELALWAIGQLDDEALTGDLVADAIALAGLPPPEEELNHAVLARVEDETVKLQMLEAAERAGNEAVADDNLGGLSAAALAIAARQLHIDGAVEVLDVEGALDLYVDAVNDPALRRATRVRAARDLAEYGRAVDPADPARATVIAALARASGAADCHLAGVAAAAHASVTGAPFPPPLPRGARPAAATRAVCKLLAGAADPVAALTALVPARGVILDERNRDPGRVAQLWIEYPDARDANRDGAPDVPEADPDGDGDPSTWIQVTRIARDDLASFPYLDELARALPHCGDDGCKLPDQQVWFRLHWKKGPRGTLLLDTIERRESFAGC